MPYDTLINGREYKLPCRVLNTVEVHFVLDAAGLNLARCVDRAVAQAICDKLNEQYYSGLIKAIAHQQQGAYRASVALFVRDEQMRKEYQRESAAAYATARDILGITED